MGGGDACERRHWGPRWSSLWGNETCERCAEVTHVSSYGATKRVRGVPGCVAGTHVSAATGAFGGAPYGATKRVRGVPTWIRVRMRTLPLEPSVELPMGPRNA